MKSFHDGKIVVHAGDCMGVLRTMPADSIDAVCTDPPYHLTSITKRFSKNGYSKSNLEQPADKNLDGIMAGSFRRLAKGFMGKVWDGGDIAFRPELWAEVLRVLKPGGHMVAFSGCRTYHRMACTIEDVGFEIRDMLSFVFGSGFPKNHSMRDIGRPELGTSLKPAHEPICLARKPLSEGTVAANVLRWGTGALNIDGCRIGIAEEERTIIDSRSGAGFGTIQCEHAGREEGEKFKSHTSGRWPANLCHDGSPEVLAGFPETTDSKAGWRNNNNQGHEGWSNGTIRSGPLYSGHSDSGSAARFFAAFPQEENQCQPLNGHANFAESSFILSSKAAVSALSRAVEVSTQRLVLHQQSYQAQDTNVSGHLLDDIETLLTATILNIEKRFLRGLQPTKHSLSSSLASIVAIPKPTGTIAITINLWKSNGYAEAVTFDCIETNLEAGASASAKRFHYTAKADANDRLNSKHPTVKPVDLMQWLVRLVCPKGATVLDPFAGTGTTGAAAFIEGCKAVLIEREAEYLADIERRMGMLLSGADERARKLATPDPHDTLPLFAVMP